MGREFLNLGQFGALVKDELYRLRREVAHFDAVGFVDVREQRAVLVAA